MNIQEELSHTLDLIRLERTADLEQYRQKVLLTPLHRKTKEGICWYPVKLRKDYIGTGERLIIEVERTTELEQKHVFQSGKMVSVFSNAHQKPERDHVGGVINYVRDNQMIITLNSDDLPDWVDNGLLGIDVMFDEMTYREMELAMKKVMKAENSRLADLRDILLGKIATSIQEHIVADHPKHLNESQQKALQHIISCNDVGIIHGPPGTGKTTTLVQAIAQTVKTEQQVLVCTPSNASIDLLVEKLSEFGLNVVRIGHPARVTEQTLSKTLDAKIAAHPNFKELRMMRKKMEQLRNQASKYKRNFGYKEKEERRFLRQEANALKADADVLEFHIINDILHKSDVITCTLVGASHPTLRGKKYKTVFVDEAAQALEPACWIPICRAERVIFAGDHFQLPPTIKSREAANNGLAETLFEKCIKRHPEAASMLQVQYRMHEDIMGFPSKYFYDDQLIADPTIKNHQLPNQSPMRFIDTAGCGYNETLDPETLSKYNEDEARLLIHSLEQLVDQIGQQEWIHAGYSIGIITPYSAQVAILLGLAEETPQLNEIASLISINTVDAFQGQERDVIAISLVRSNDSGEIGFLNDIRRTNVAITRARKKVIIIGDSSTLYANPFYNELVEYVQNKNYYQSAFELIQP
ncbi:MAG TPA: AAA domain-containing protein [Cyclobacteriaceae bacterium]|nr:AAA domain-containing protein [Cyclobacteriaceae bacterium]